MKIALLSITVFAFVSAAPAFAVEVNSAVGVYYFSSNPALRSAAQAEHGEGNLVFLVSREPREVARDLAAAEMKKGNVCLNQARRDLKAALQSKLISQMCRDVFQDEIFSAQASIRRANKKAGEVNCEVGVEARETPASIRLVLTLQAKVSVRERLPLKLAQAGFSEEPKSWELPSREVELGESQEGWKGILKSRSCAVGEGVIREHLERFLQESKEARVAAQCRQRLSQQLSELGKLQNQFEQYIPTEWLTDAGGSGDLLKPLARPSSSMDLESCRTSKEEASARLDSLRTLAEVIASHHEIPAFDPENHVGGRSPASEDFE